MGLPESVEACLREKKYVIILQKLPVEQMEITIPIDIGRLDKICNVTYNHNSDLRVSFTMAKRRSLDTRLSVYIMDSASKVGAEGNPATFYEAFEELCRASGRF